MQYYEVSINFVTKLLNKIAYLHAEILHDLIFRLQ